MCAIRDSLHAVVLEGKISLPGLVIDAYSEGGGGRRVGGCSSIQCPESLLRVLRDTQLMAFLSFYMSSRRLRAVG